MFDKKLSTKQRQRYLVVAQLWEEFFSIREWNLCFEGNMARVFPFLEWRQHQSLRDSSYFFEILGIIEKSTTRRLYGALMAFPMRAACTKQLGPKFPAPTNGVRHFPTLFLPMDDISILLHGFYIFSNARSIFNFTLCYLSFVFAAIFWKSSFASVRFDLFDNRHQNFTFTWNFLIFGHSTNDFG